MNRIGGVMASVLASSVVYPKIYSSNGISIISTDLLQ